MQRPQAQGRGREPAILLDVQVTAGDPVLNRQRAAVIRQAGPHADVRRVDAVDYVLHGLGPVEADGGGLPAVPNDQAGGKINAAAGRQIGQRRRSD